MPSPRENILSRLRAKQQTVPPVTAFPLVHSDKNSLDQRITAFRSRMEAVRAEVHLTDRAHWTDRLRTLCSEKKLADLLYAPASPLGSGIEHAWKGQASLPRLVAFEGDIDRWKHPLFYRVSACVTSVHAGIAHTGTLVLWPGREEPRSYSLVPPLHIAVLESRHLFNRFDELVEAQAWQRGLPSNVLLISGPSKTADIEQTLSYGIHGPTALIVLLLR